MLLRFSVENFRSIHAPAELSLMAIDGDRDVVRHPAGTGLGVLPAAGVFGANASGKTNVLLGLAWLSRAARDSLRDWDESIPVDPFALLGSLAPRSSFTADLLLDGVRFEYLLDVTSERVEYEALFYYPKRYRKRLFERDGSKISLETGRFPSPVDIKRVLTDRVLLLTLLPRLGEDPQITGVHHALRSIQPLGTGLHAPRHTLGPIGPGIPPETLLALDESRAQDDHRARALALLRCADLGITGATVIREQVDTGLAGHTLRRQRLRLQHGHGESARLFDLDQESAGTIEWLRTIGPALKALEQGTVLLCDEIDASLHPVLSVELLHLFQSPQTNPRGAQLLFTTHDTNLLNRLNRDEVWLTQRNQDGSTYLGPLSDFAGESVRRSTNLERAYLAGRFGALPDIRAAEVQRALGLIP